jgi:hypothetical protein
MKKINFEQEDLTTRKQRMHEEREMTFGVFFGIMAIFLLFALAGLLTLFFNSLEWNFAQQYHYPVNINQ